ncbi:hypothetical protein N8T08_003172 [Aspergillus melleus]|uniref:Uncharacterized protein n=1 Tax=Aspergillus melleus TaxID=138277 RepID=A0ACC3B782_9EURO|nr:hypothetical protein N8T08_003172 [Aspergillus melleus]
MEHTPNPILLQKGDSSRTPLFLLHDAGGTVYNYYKLGNVGRPIYAISNPWIKAKTKWEGGAMRFVHEYIKLIKSVVSSGEILIGGWSLGGQFGIDIGRVLASNPRSRLSVVGVVMIDTLYPYWGPPETPHAEFPVDLVLRNCPEDLRAEMIRCMQWSKEDSDEWVRRNWKDNADELDELEAEEPPPGVLILAKGFVPVDPSNDGESSTGL